jgi:hypothetical protein
MVFPIHMGSRSERTLSMMRLPSFVFRSKMKRSLAKPPL